MKSSTIDPRLFLLIRSIYTNTSLLVRCSHQGHLTQRVPTQLGVKQGCVLAPLLFNYFINDIISKLSSSDFHPPKLADRPISILLYADDALILSRTPVGVRRALRSLAQYCKEACLTINYQKTKVMTFAKRPKTRPWSINGRKIEQVHCFKYLGIVFHDRGSRKAHLTHVVAAAQKSTSAIRFFRIQRCTLCTCGSKTL